MKTSSKKRAKKLASLSALGAGALVLAAPESAEASIVYTPVNETLSTLNGPLAWTSNPLALPNEVLRFSVYASGSHAAAWANSFQAPMYWGATSSGSFLKLVNKGVSPVLAGPYLQFSHRGSLVVGAFNNIYTASKVRSYGPGQFSHKFAFFSFKDATFNRYDFGWVQLSLKLVSSDLRLTIQDYAYQTDGTLLAAGAGAVPEPATSESIALAALALGAVGLRRWRAAKKAA